MYPVSSFTAAAVAELKNAKPLFETTHAAYEFNIYLSGDSLWLTAGQKKAGRIAFRLAFSGGNELTLDSQSEDAGRLVFSLRSATGDLRVELTFSDDGIFRYTTTLKPGRPTLIPFWPKDMLPLAGNGDLQVGGKIHAAQVGTRSGLMYLSMAKPKSGSVFYFQNFSALNPFFEATKTSAAETVGGKWPELGFALPAVTEQPLPENEEFIISDAFVRLTPDVPEGDIAITTAFLDNLAAVYRLMPRPEVKYHEWRETAAKGLDGLANHKGCWTFAGGHPYLNAYLSDYKTPPEIMVQLAIMLPLLEYCDWTGEKHQMMAELRDGLPAFWDEKLQTVVRWLPVLNGNLDNSEEQKQVGVMDSWYLHHPLMNMTRLADRGDKLARELLIPSVDYAIKVAKHFDYEWPVFYKMDTLEVLKEETQPGEGGEKDVPAAYAKLMVEVWGLTGDDKYLQEAKRAVKSLDGLAFDVFYQANNTAFGAVALLRLYKQTKDEWFLNMSYVCIASIFKNVQLWDCDYGCGKYFPSFFSVFPLKDAPYTAAYEEQEVYSTLHGYLQESSDIDILPSVRLLVSEFVRYAIARMPYYFPTMLNEEMLSEEVKTGEIDPNLWIPLEDIHDGWEKSGEVGQEVYGACVSFGIVPRQYLKLPDDMMLYVDYPISDLKMRRGKGASFRLLGDAGFSCRCMIFFYNEPRDVEVLLGSGKRTEQVSTTESDSSDKPHIEFMVPGNAEIKLKWG
ncbi:hypothetical protein [Pedobacter sp. SYP-B3415]|uniref:hypothetical protein n=1 Tax=Pedobacter sp. SYP-B3415 TaxID=2496641 RepID=UPI00101BDB47|nr:hypothetical protein [Pedobacter sp. SYP-B3415]